ncbi:MAG TPA: SigE family RNA polymerase sigma factor [Streptosporangiaceae bacterium]|nr:SigE family RNA polymerase sigma factor [Streptosporangiaceae bacterium]
MAYLRTRNLADAEDLVQAALARTYQAWDLIQDRNALDGYVRRAMANTHISWWRRRRLEEYPTDEVPDRTVADHAADGELSESVQRALDRLPSRMRAAVILRYREDMSETEVAAALGISQGHRQEHGFARRGQAPDRRRATEKMTLPLSRGTIPPRSGGARRGQKPVR